MTDQELGNLLATAIMLIIKRVQLDDSERISIAEVHQPWKQGTAYGNSEYVRFGVKADGRAQLWMSLRSVPATAPAPDQPASPANWKKL